MAALKDGNCYVSWEVGCCTWSMLKWWKAIEKGFTHTDSLPTKQLMASAHQQTNGKEIGHLLN